LPICVSGSAVIEITGGKRCHLQAYEWASFNKKEVLMYINRIIFSVLFLLIAACSNELKNKSAIDDKKSDARKPEVTTYEVTEPNFIITGDQEPHVYQVEIRWPKNPNPVVVLIDNEVAIRVLPTESNSFAFKAHNRTVYLITIEEEVGEKTKTIDERKIQVPTDYVFSSTETLVKDTEIKANRIYFKKSVQIETGPFNFTVSGDEIFFEDGAKIFNFQNPPKPINQKAGVGGGGINILSRVAHGKIEIALSGGEGGQGQEAFPWVIPHPPGADGVAGVCRHDSLVPSCITQPIDGEKSPDGNRGKQGFQGLSGGNSGALTIEILEESDVEVIHTENPGVGGEGGQGGIGQMKGRPGKAAPRDESCMCPQGKDGEDTGKNGDSGLPGSNGPDGEIGKICISVGKGANQCVK
jgi:hypothetical protein